MSGLSSNAPTFQIFAPKSKDPYLVLDEKYDLPVKKIKQYVESGTANEVDKSAVFLEFAKEPTKAIKTISDPDKIILADFIIGNIECPFTDGQAPYLDFLRLILGDKMVALYVT